MSIKHYKNGEVRVGGASLSYANAFSLSLEFPIAEATPFQATETTKSVGIKSWGGNISAYTDQDANILYTAATAGASTLIALYPDGNDATTYWSGYAYLNNYRAQGAVDTFGTETCDFVGTGTLTETGFD